MEKYCFTYDDEEYSSREEIEERVFQDDYLMEDVIKEVFDDIDIDAVAIYKELARLGSSLAEDIMDGIYSWINDRIEEVDEE